MGASVIDDERHVVMETPTKRRMYSVLLQKHPLHIAATMGLRPRDARQQRKLDTFLRTTDA